MDPALTAIVSTFRSPRSLALCLAALEEDARGLGVELIVADDGDTEHESRAAAERAARSGAFLSVRRLWQAHDGYGKCRLANKAAAGARGATLFYLDGDCLVARGTVQLHLRLRAPRRYVSGSPIRLGPGASAQLGEGEARAFLHASPRWITLQAARGEVESKSHYAWLRAAPLRVGRLFRRTGSGGFNGCCASLPSALLREVNGWDESLPGYGFDDTDLGHRLQNAGAEPVSVRVEGMVVHLWHDRPYRGSADDYEKKRKLVAATLGGTKVLAERGLSELGPHDPAVWEQF
jgi:GT2 family glycosyltransferase